VLPLFSSSKNAIILHENAGDLAQQQAVAAQNSHAFLANIVQSTFTAGIQSLQAADRATLSRGCQKQPGLAGHISSNIARNVAEQFGSGGPHAAFIQSLRQNTQPTTSVVLPNGQMRNTRMIGKSTSNAGQKARNNRLNVPSTTSTSRKRKQDSNLFPEVPRAPVAAASSSNNNSIKTAHDPPHRLPADLMGTVPLLTGAQNRGDEPTLKKPAAVTQDRTVHPPSQHSIPLLHECFGFTGDAFAATAASSPLRESAARPPPSPAAAAALPPGRDLFPLDDDDDDEDFDDGDAYYDGDFPGTRQAVRFSLKKSPTTIGLERVTAAAARLAFGKPRTVWNVDTGIDEVAGGSDENLRRSGFNVLQAVERRSATVRAWIQASDLHLPDAEFSSQDAVRFLNDDLEAQEEYDRRSTRHED